MAIQLAHVKDMSKIEWLKTRKNGIGGSDASAILGLSPYKSVLELYMDKTSPGVTKNDLDQNEYQYWGTILEDIVAKEFSKQTGLKVRRNNFMLQHPQFPFMIADLDREIVGEKKGLECKTANEFAKDQWEEGIPDYYYAQVQHYMAVTGYDGFYVAVLIGGNKFKYCYIERDERFIMELVQKEREFWECVKSKTPPKTDGSKATERYLAQLYPNGIPVKVGLPDEVNFLLFEREEIEQKIKKAKKQKREIDNKVKAIMKKYEKAYTSDWNISWTTCESNRFNSKKLKKEMPEIYEKYVTKSTYRRFSVRKNKKNNK